MYEDNRDDEFSIINESLLHFSHQYDYRKPNAKPLIYFDAIHCLFDALLDTYNSASDKNLIESKRKTEIYNTLFNCSFVYASFADKALEVNNGDGISLSGMKLRNIYTSAVNNHQDAVAKDILRLIVRLAISCAVKSEEIEGESNGSQNIVNNLEEVIVNSPYKHIIEKEVYESFFRLKYDHSKMLAYIKSLGGKINSDFGLNLD